LEEVQSQHGPTLSRLMAEIEHLYQATSGLTISTTACPRIARRLHQPPCLLSDPKQPPSSTNKHSSASMQLQPIPTLLLLLPIALAHVERASSCTGALQDGYCCNGSIFQKTHNTDYSAGNMICCEGDPHVQIDTSPNAPTSCTAGTEVPLTEASGGERTGTPSTASASASSSSANTAAAAVASVSNAVGKVRLDVSMMAAAAALGGAAFGL
jgi:hypothetical protein